MKKTIHLILITILLGSSFLSFITNAQEDCDIDFSLPEEYNVTMMVETGSDSYFEITFDQDYDHIIDGTYKGWCIEDTVRMTIPSHHSGSLYSSYQNNLPEFFNNPKDHYVWQRVNYLLNNKENIIDEIKQTHHDLTFTTSDIQHTIWNLTSDKSYNEIEKPSVHQLITYLFDESRQTEIQSYCPEISDQLIILVDTYENLDHPEKNVQHIIFQYPLDTESTQNDKPKPSRKTGGSTGSRNTLPTADLSNGEPYQGTIDESITFDGTKSYDYDGTIVDWNWSMGNGEYVQGEIINYQYQKPGTYTVTLTVKDNKGATNTDETKVTIILQDRPPNTPIITGSTICEKYTQYEYTAKSIDPDNNTIRYTFEWGDGTQSTTTEFIDNNTAAKAIHQWNTPGLFVMKVFAEDSYNLPSNTVKKIILVDSAAVYLTDQIQGMLVDKGNNGTYDLFYNNFTGIHFGVKQVDQNSVLIDSDDDGEWNWSYNTQTNTLSQYSKKNTSESEDIPFIGIIFLLAMIIVLIITGFLYYRMR